MQRSNNRATTKEMTFRELILTLKTWFRYLRSKWLVLTYAVLLGAAMGASYSLFTTPRYIAKTTFVLEESSQNGSLGALSGISSVLGASSPGIGLFTGDNIIWLYSSNRMIGETLLRTVNRGGEQVLLINWLLHIDNDLQKRVRKLNNDIDLEDFVDSSMKLSQLSRLQSKILSYAISNIRDHHLVVKVEDNTDGIIQVSISSKDESFSYAFVNQIVQTVNEFYIDTKTKKGKEQVQLLQSKVDEFNKNMNSSMYQAANAVDAIPNANPSMQMLRVTPQRSSVDVQVNSAIYSTMVQQLESAKVSLAKATPLIQIVDQPRFPLPVKRPSVLVFTIGAGFISCLITALFILGMKVYKEAI